MQYSAAIHYCISIIMCVVYNRLSCKMEHIAFYLFLQLKFQKRNHYIIGLYMYIYIVLRIVCVLLCIQNVWFGYLMIDDVSFYINICLYYVHYTFNNLFYIFIVVMCI